MAHNLLDNALRHTPSDGRIRIEVRNCRGRVEVSIADSGSGIAPEHLPQLFERPSPTGRNGGRVSGGLGSLVVSRISALHECSIRVESTVGQGTVFRFEVPTPAFARKAGRLALTRRVHEAPKPA